MSSDIRQKVVVSIIVEKSANAETKRQIDEVQKRLDALAKAAKEATPDVQKALATIGLGARAQISPLQELNNTIQGLTGKLGQGVGAIDKFAKGLAPWNQALELGGKAVRFATDALDAHAKTSVQAARDVKKLKDEFASYRDTVMQGAGSIALELLKPAVSLNEQWKAMMKIQNSALYKQLYQSGGLLSGSFNGKNLDDDTKAALAKYGITFAKKELDPLVALGEAIDGVKEGIDSVSNTWSINGKRFVDDMADSMGKTADETKRLADEAKRAALEHARWKAEYDLYMSEARRNESKNYLDVRKPQESTFTAGAIDPGMLAQNDAIGGAMDSHYQKLAEAGRADAYAASATSRNDSFLAKTFGEVGEFDIYKTAFEGLTDAVGGTYEAIITGSEPAGKAFKRLAAETIMTIGKQSLVEAAKETAYGFGNLAKGNIPGATLHFTAAAKHALVAGLAGGAAAGLGAGGGGSTGGASASSGGSGGTNTNASSFGNGQAPAGGERIIVYMGDSHGRNSPRMEYLEAQRVVDLAFGGNGVTSR